MSDPVHVYVIAGEPSGDILGQALMRALKQATAGCIRFSGIGGRLMQNEELASLFPMEDLSVMGIAEVLPRLSLLLQRIDQTAEDILSQRPDIVVTIDSPDFSFRVARKIQSCRPKTKIVHYVAPTVWAWRPGRAKKLSKLYDGVICLFPFEPGYFIREGMKAVFAGHPVLSSGWDFADPSAMRAQYTISANRRVLGVLFGSRGGALKRMAPVLREAALNIVKSAPDFHVVSVTLPHLKDRVAALLKDFPCGVTIVSDPAHKWHAFSVMDVAMATSGTVGLELAVAGVPHVIAYKMNPVTWQIVDSQAKVDYAHLVNILLNREAVPEFIQSECRVDMIAAGIRNLIENPERIMAQKRDFRAATHLIGGDSYGTPAQQAADFVLSLLS